MSFNNRIIIVLFVYMICLLFIIYDNITLFLCADVKGLIVLIAFGVYFE